MSPPPEKSGRRANNILLRLLHCPNPQEALCVIIGLTATALFHSRLFSSEIPPRLVVIFFAWGEVKDVGWLRSKLVAPLGKTSPVSRSWEPPREARNLFPIYRQFLHYKLSSHHIYGLIPLPWSAATFPPAPGKSGPRGKFGRQCQLLVTNFSPLTFDLLVTNGHSSEQVSVWDDVGQKPDDCVCETFVLSRRAVQPCSDPIIALFR